MKKLLEQLGIELTEEKSPEETEDLILEKIKQKDEHISNLESEYDALSKANEELTASVEGYKSSEEKLTKELADTKVELTTTKGKLEQVTDMYKEQFTKDPEQQEQTVKDDTAFKNDVLQQILDTK